MIAGPISRRDWLLAAAGSLALAGCRWLRRYQPTSAGEDHVRLRDRVEGLLLGSMIGDAAGGPVEFKTHDELIALLDPVRTWQPDDRLDQTAIEALSRSFQLLPYRGLRPEPAPYGQWTADAPAGTVTDDTRIKIMLFSALKQAWERNRLPITAQDVARQFVEYPFSSAVQAHAGYPGLCDEWLAEINRSANWMLGNRSLPAAAPPERLWGGLATCCGQMLLTPVAGLYPGQPESAYKAAYSIGFLDNGPGKDLNAALVAGLAAALAHQESDPRSAWQAVRHAMVATDPYGYGNIPYVERAVDRWLRFAEAAVERADRAPARLFKILEQELQAQTWWEAHVPFVTVFACLQLCSHEPLAAMQLCLDFGYDTDSSAQLLGAFAGAMHGATTFPRSMRGCVAQRLNEDYEQSVTEWVDLLLTLQDRGRCPEPIAFLA